jgi:diguanylate cyclase (GGDEF)-like protein/PAS domain S-box-containing protein
MPNLSCLFNWMNHELRQHLVRVTQWLLNIIQRLHSLAAGHSDITTSFNQNPLLQQALDSIPSAVFVKNREGRFLAVNQESAKMHHSTVEEMLGKCDPEFNPHVSVEQYEEFLRTNRQAMDTRQTIHVPLQAIMTRDGELRWYQTTIRPLIGANDQVLGIIGNSADITELKQMQKELEQLATMDALTQIANRRRFDHYLYQTWQQFKQTQQCLSLILLDIDYFKNYNDCYGHQQGDYCLIQVAQTIDQMFVASANLVARYGGEEFAVILPNTDPAAAVSVAEAIRQAVQNLSLPHAHSAASPVITLSAGVATQCPKADQQPECLICLADQALYQAKQQGRNRVVSARSRK